LKVGRVKFAVKEIKIRDTPTADPKPEMEADNKVQTAERLFGLAANAPSRDQ
jgi:hypothetical protein